MSIDLNKIIIDNPTAAHEISHTSIFVSVPQHMKFPTHLSVSVRVCICAQVGMPLCMKTHVHMQTIETYQEKAFTSKAFITLP